ncbi:hypothetical protein K2173_024937 [Erythroxylum novogranatense]|uniref:DUF4378 domain-containing protein n=1 Tax=Erythroxylum novogranatense TaxID=1862640 RepID=A0AAV8UG58_9ROSI|nr:hypothetical protein K2173_024937 [Erythroxylum novogranatense]
MVFPNDSCSSRNGKQRNQIAVEGQSRMLKDFLVDDPNSCSSNKGFKSVPRKPHGTSNTYPKLLRSPSKAALTTFSAFQAIINAVKNIPFTAIARSPSILSRTLSRRRSKDSKPSAHRRSETNDTETRVTVTVKDIIRWRSFRDLIDEDSPQLDLASPPHCTTATTNSTASTPCSSSNASSWCFSDVTAESLSFWNGEIGFLEGGKKYLPRVGDDSVEATPEKKSTTTFNEVGPKDDEPQHSPVSVIEFGFNEDEDEESISSFDQKLDIVQRENRELTERIKQFESLSKEWASMEEDLDTNLGKEDEKGTGTMFDDEVEEQAWQLLNQLKPTMENCRHSGVDQLLLLNFFTDELTQVRCRSSETMLEYAEAWIKGEQDQCKGWEVEHKREGYVRDMEKGQSWRNFEEEKEGLVLTMEDEMVTLLIDELLVDLSST